MSDYLFEAHTPTGQCITRFRESLEDDRQARAALRRSNSLTDIVLVPAYHRLLHEFGEALTAQTGDGKQVRANRYRLRLAAIAGLLAHTKQHVPLRDEYKYSIAAQMAQPKQNSQGPCVSDLRFRRLLQESDIEALYPMLRRVLPLTNNSVDIHLMAADIWFWGEKRRRQWAYDYYAQLQPAQRAS